jgi:hypothetical protein
MEEEPSNNEEESEDSDEEQTGKNLSFEEARKEFSSKGKTLLNTGSRPLRNLIGESSTWRKDDWSTKAGKSLPRQPVDQPGI